MSSLIELYDSRNMSDVVLARIARCAFNYYKGKSEGGNWGQFGFPEIISLLERGHDFTDRDSQQNKVERHRFTEYRFYVSGANNPDYFGILISSIQKVFRDAGKFAGANIENGGIFPYSEFAEVIKEPLGYDVFLTMGKDKDFGGEPIINFDYRPSDRAGVKINYPDGRKREVEQYSNWKYPKMHDIIAKNIQYLENRISRAKAFGHTYQNTYQEYLRFLNANASAIVWRGYEYSKPNADGTRWDDTSCDLHIPLKKLLDIQIPAG